MKRIAYPLPFVRLKGFASLQEQSASIASGVNMIDCQYFHRVPTTIKIIICCDDDSDDDDDDNDEEELVPA